MAGDYVQALGWEGLVHSEPRITRRSFADDDGGYREPQVSHFPSVLN
jgi:hypothetical protein